MAFRLGQREAARRLSASDRQARAVELFVAGWSYRRIAVELGYAGPSGVKKAIDGAIRKAPSRAVKDLRAEIDERARLQLEELELLRQQIKPIALGKRVSADKRLAAADRLIKTVDAIVKIDRELRAMHGVDAPTKKQISGPGGGPIAIVDFGELAELTDEQLSHAREALARSAEAHVRPAGDAADRPGAGSTPEEESGEGDGG